MTRRLFFFDDHDALNEGAYTDRAQRVALLGGKGAGLEEMTRLGVPVPPGFVLPTHHCDGFVGDARRAWEGGVREALREGMTALGERVGRRFGDASAPLLVSVRSGAAASMPGMMDSVLNIGLTAEAIPALVERTGDERFAWDAYRRLLQMYGAVVARVPAGSFEAAVSGLKTELGRPTMRDAELDAAALRDLCGRFEQCLEGSLPHDPWEQLEAAVEAVFASWHNPRAARYRAMQGVSDDPSLGGTACTVQAMVFGNLGDQSGSGVAFTRNPSTGRVGLYGEYIHGAQGEDIVAGRRTPTAINKAGAVPGREDQSLEARMPEAFAAIEGIAQRLEAHFRDMQDIEFTVERGQVYVLQTRAAKRAPEAAVRVAVELAEREVITRDEALLMVDADVIQSLFQARLPTPDELAERGISPVAAGLPASPGTASGRIVFDPERAERMAREGQDVILVRRETTPEDITAMKAARGILTAAGGMTSHAAVVARGLAKCCVAGASTLEIDYANQTILVRPRRRRRREAPARPSEAPLATLAAGDVITLDGTHGQVYRGELDVVAAAKVPELDTLLTWADERRRLRVRANADTPHDVRAARAFGAEGVGLCRTEHMFFADERLEAIRCVVLADEPDRERWVRRIEEMQRQDFVEIFDAMDGYPVTIRLLDWPLHEFMPREDESLHAVASALGVSMREARRRAGNRDEMNPMIGHRGVRVGMTIPDVYRAQIRAVVAAALECAERGVDVRPELLIPLVAVGAEAEAVALAIHSVTEELFAEAGRRVPLAVGTMIELPRACLVADELAAHASFFSFGTNDLTQTTFGISRDDSAHFIPAYVEELGVLGRNPFKRLDTRGVGQLIQIAVERGRQTRPELELGVCGVQGSDPESVPFFERLGFDYVSCTLPRLVVARLAAAQAVIRAD